MRVCACVRVRRWRDPLTRCCAVQAGKVGIFKRSDLPEGDVVRDTRNMGSLVLTLSGGDFFGERSLMSNEPRAASVVAMERTVCITIDRQHFEACLSNVASMLGSYHRSTENEEVLSLSEHLASYMKLVAASRMDTSGRQAVKRGGPRGSVLSDRRGPDARADGKAAAPPLSRSLMGASSSPASRHS